MRIDKKIYIYIKAREFSIREKIYIKIRNHAIILQFPSNKYFISNISEKKQRHHFFIQCKFCAQCKFFSKKKKKRNFLRNFNNNNDIITISFEKKIFLTNRMRRRKLIIIFILWTKSAVTFPSESKWNNISVLGRRCKAFSCWYFSGKMRCGD